MYITQSPPDPRRHDKTAGEDAQLRVYDMYIMYYDSLAGYSLGWSVWCFPVQKFRELGCSSQTVRIQVAPQAGGAASAASTTSYNIMLLASGTKSLAQSFPRPKVLKKAGGKR